MERATVAMKDLAKNGDYPNAKHLCVDDWDTIPKTKTITYYE